MARPKNPLISEQGVIEAATRILEEEGLEAFSLRNLGARLNINSASLYHHFANKDDILLSVVRTALREMELPALTEHWESWICETAVGYRNLLIKKPFLIPLMLGGIRPRTVVYAIADAKLSDAGVPEDVRPEFLMVLDNAAVASALVSINSPRDASENHKFDHEKMLRSTIRLLVEDMIGQYRRNKRSAKRAKVA